MRKINFGIIGCGRIAKRHAEHISDQARLVAICDNNEAALGKFLAAYPQAKAYTSIEEMLTAGNDMDVVNICTPNGLHAEHTIKALKAGKHVVCEKPMALTSNDCQRMIEESLIAQKYLFVVKQNRFNPPVQKLKEVIDAGRLGKIYSAQLNCFWNRGNEYYQDTDWKGTKALDGGILFTQFSHFIDLFLWLLGTVQQVKVMSNNYHHQNVIEFEDTLVSIVKFESGMIGTMNFTINAYRKNMEGSITIFGEKGTIKVGGQYLNELDYQSIEGLEITDIPAGNKPNDYGSYQGSMSNHDKVIANVIDVITNGGRIAVNGFDGLRTTELIQTIYNNATSI
jgi:UDP-N-acetyl-2-amino-2-deoxyglucuronate dehydrogenase